MKPSIAAIDALLPQTQCGLCGHGGCLPYATAIATQNEAINRCPPGGERVLNKLAELLQVPVIPLQNPAKPNQVAVIVEEACIGCMKCIPACPVDAIVGASKLMHTVIQAACTGCELCVAPCPMDCIEILPIAELETEAFYAKAQSSRERYEQHNLRLAANQSLAQQQHEIAVKGEVKTDDQQAVIAARKAFIAEAVARAQAKKGKPAR